LWNKKAIVFKTMTMSAYQDQLIAGFSKVCEVCGSIARQGMN